MTTATPRSPVGRLLVVSYHFPPDGAVGGLRWAALTKYLSRIGWSCWVLTASEGPRDAKSHAPVIVETCPRRRTLNDRYRAARLRRRSGAPGAVPASPASGAEGRGLLPRAVARLRLEGAMALGLPDEARGWIARAAVRARALVRRVRPHVVVSSGPPHSTHLSAWLAVRGTGVPWIADLRDPWGGPIAPAWQVYPSYRSWLSRFALRFSERRLLPRASAIFANSPSLVEALAEVYPAVRGHWVPNAADRELLPPASDSPFPGLGMVYLGTLYGDRDLAPVLRGLRAMLDRNALAAADGTCLRVAGALDPRQVEALRAAADALGLARQVEVLGLLPRARALDVLARSRLCIVLAQGQLIEIPAKLYEPVAMGIPTLVVGSRHSASEKEAARLRASFVEPDDRDGMASLLERAWSGRNLERPAPAAAADYAHVARLVSELLRHATA